MRAISLFAGVGGLDLGFERAGMTCVGQCEIDPHARAVLERHWPDVPKHDDITTLKGNGFGPAEVVVWGSPCQNLSAAGKREGLKGDQSSLFTEGIRFIRELRHATDNQYPRFSVWENVPGAFSSNAGRDFRAVLEAFLEAEVPMPRSGKWANAGVVRGNGREVAWRVLDSQHFGVAQRRRRVFVVADFGGQRAAEILFEREGVPGHPQQGRAAREEAARGARGGPESGSRAAPFDLAQITNPHNRNKVAFGAPANPLTASGFSDPCVALAGGGHLPMVMPTMRSGGANDTKSKGQVSGDTRDEYIVPVAFAMRGRAEGNVPEVAGDVANALRGASGGSTRDMVAFAATDYSTGSFAETGASGPLTGTRDRSRAATLVNPVTYGVRRLTPRECERLQGLPGDHTRYRPDGSEIADTHRYRLCGNAVTVNVAEWLGHRVAAALAAGELEDAA